MVSRSFRYTISQPWLTPDELIKPWQPASSTVSSEVTTDPVDLVPSVETVTGDDNEAERADDVQSVGPSEYDKLQQWLLFTTLAASLIIATTVAFTYSLSIAANYLLGAIGGLIYLRMLGRSVAQLGKSRPSLGASRLGIFVGLVLVATQLESLQILPIFLGFMTYKAAFVVYMVQMLSRPSRSQQ